jgi:hypothetical protein
MAESLGGLIQTGSVTGQELAEMFSVGCEFMQAVNNNSSRNILRK